MKTAVIFDIDGTLFDWETAVRSAVEVVLRNVPPDARDLARERFARALEEHAFVRRGDAIVDRRHWLLRVDPEPPWLAALGGEEPQRVTELALEFRAQLRPVAFPDARPALEALRGDYRIGVLTNSPKGEDSLQRLGFRDFFEAIVILGDHERKPRPAAFNAVCEVMRVDRSAAAHVGDSIANDVEGALNAGLHSIWIDRYDEPHLLPRGADRVESLTQLPGILGNEAD